MSFIRPELAERLLRWREVLIWGAVAAFGLWLLLRGLVSGAWLWSVAGALATSTGAAFLPAALRQVWLRGRSQTVGITRIDEGRIGYLGPYSGGYVDISALRAVSLRVRPHAAAWELLTEDDQHLDIPVDAPGAEALPDALARLPGIELGAAFEALRRAKVAHQLLWTKDNVVSDALPVQASVAKGRHIE